MRCLLLDSPSDTTYDDEFEIGIRDQRPNILEEPLNCSKIGRMPVCHEKQINRFSARTRRPHRFGKFLVNGRQCQKMSLRRQFPAKEIEVVHGKMNERARGT